MSAPLEFRWDDRSHQPHRIDKSRRYREYARHLPAHARLAGICLGALPALVSAYRRLEPFTFPAGPLPAGFGISTEIVPERLERLLDEIRDLDADSVLLRVPSWRLDLVPHARSFISVLRERGVEAVVAVLQDRRAVEDPDRWESALETIASELGPLSSALQVGHAWNRIKWGVRTHREYRLLFERAARVRERHPGLRLAGPAVIDFEYYYAAGALLGSDPCRFDVITALLYVDRRGAPENTQWGHFDLVRKLRLMRALGDISASREAPLWITEMNWPLAVAGGYAPTSMAEAVDEDRHADFLVRYYLAALASGMASKVFWWQVAAHGYGLVDDLEGGWRRRPAWHAFRQMTTTLAGAELRYVEILPDRRVLAFRRGDQSITVAWAVGRRAELPGDWRAHALVSRDGAPLPPPSAGPITLTGSPVYLISPD